MLENEMAANKDNLKTIVEQGNQMAREGHFDSAGILKAVKDFDKRWDIIHTGLSVVNMWCTFDVRVGYLLFKVIDPFTTRYSLLCLVNKVDSGIEQVHILQVSTVHQYLN